MTYPVENPTNKHDLIGPGVHFTSEVLAENKVPSTSKLFEQLEQGQSRQGTKMAAVYTYPDGPRVPGPLSRGLFIVGFADSSLSLVRKLFSDDAVLPCFSSCTMGVKLADASHAAKLPSRDVANSRQFAKLMTVLRKEDAVAILGQDKHGRFGILRPMNHEVASAEFVAEDFAALCYVGIVQEVKEYLSGGVSDEQPGMTKGESSIQQNNECTTNGELWQPPSADRDGISGLGGQDFSSGLWQPPDTDDPGLSGEMDVDTGETGPWQPPSIEEQTVGEKRKRSSSFADGGTNDGFHEDSGAAAADRFYSGLKRDLDTRADSRLYHMRAFNGWVKATQIQELEPKTKGKKSGEPLRVLDLACGKGGDLGKWILHHRGVSNYVGIDVARGSLQDAALRARRLRNKLKRCTFTCADLGSDVPGRPRSPRHQRPQELLSWSLQTESEHESQEPRFEMVQGGGISIEDKFDVVSIQFAIHYMMSSKTRARRFFQTVSQLLEVGGNLIVTTIDARVVLEHMMNLGVDFHSLTQNESTGEQTPGGTTIAVGGGACRIHFENDTVYRIFKAPAGNAPEDDFFGLQYTFTLIEGSDHAAGVGDAVNLAEWLSPTGVLSSLASESGLELEYAQNFHEFYAARRDPLSFPTAHNALYNMKVLNRNGSLSDDEWEVSRLYAALKFRKVRESSVVLDDDVEEEERQEVSKSTSGQAAAAPSSPTKENELLPIAMVKAKKSVGGDQWQFLTSEEKKHFIQLELDKMLKS